MAVTLTNAQRNALDADLTEAYHVIFDVKDEAAEHARINLGDPTVRDAEAIRYRAYETIQHLSRLMAMLGFTVPNRMDGEGR